MPSSYRLTVIIAEESAMDNLGRIFEVLQPGQHPDVEYIVCSSSANGANARLPEGGNVRWMSGSGRIPLLWRDGILAAQAERVALTTAQCIPDAGWLSRLLEIRLQGNLVGVGGPVANARDSDMRGWAIYLLRYLRFRPSRKAAEVYEIAADNALYRVRDIRANADLLEAGFWEPSFHKRFRNAHLTLKFDPGLITIHHNRYSTRGFLRQRFDHGSAFGQARAAEMTRAALWTRWLLAPAIPIVLLVKILREALGSLQYSLRAFQCLPWLILFVCGWSLGEVTGYLKVLNHSARPSPR